MKDEELLVALKGEMLLTEARARGAQEAYEREAIRQARILLREKHQIEPHVRVVVHFTNGDFVYEYREVAWDWREKEPVLMGRKILKSGKLSKNNWNEMICGISYLHNVTKQTPNVAIDGSEQAQLANGPARMEG